MSDEWNCKDINASLEKAIIIFGFKEILTKYGIQLEEKKQ